MDSPTNKYFIYVRKSSEEEERQALSIEAQLEELREFAVAQKLYVIKEFQESKSARYPGRVEFGSMLKAVERGEADGIIAWHPDRLARNAADGGLVIDALDRNALRSLKFPIFHFENTAQGKFSLMIAFGQAKYYVDNLSENVKRGIRQKIRRGEFSGKATTGYVNDPRSRTIVPHPKYFKRVKTALEEFASGRHSVMSFWERLYELGVRNATSGKRIALFTASKMLRNPFYYGICRFRNELYKGAHKVMITKEVFDQIQINLDMQGKPRKQQVPNGFFFRGLTRCATCGFAVTPEQKVKKSGLRFVYYHCVQKPYVPRCTGRFYMREEMLADLVRDQARSIALTDKIKDMLLERVSVWEQEDETVSATTAELLRKEIGALRTKIQRLNDLYLDGDLDLVEYKEAKNGLVVQKVGLEQKLTLHVQTAGRRLEPLKKWIFEANSVEKAIAADNLPELNRLLQKFGSNRFLKADTLTVEFKKPWNLLAKTNFASRFEPDESQQFEKWCAIQGSNL